MAAVKAVNHVQDGFIIGLGSGSTAAYAIQELGRRIREEGLRILGVPTSHQALLTAAECGVPLTTLHEHPQIDLTIDGADEIDPQLNLLKGMGGALTQEKIVASASKRLIIVADETKLVQRLGSRHPIPVEVIPSAFRVVAHRLRELGGRPVLRAGTGKVGPVITDHGNFILDVEFGPVQDPGRLHQMIKAIPGVVETGLFINMTHTAYIGTPTEVKKLIRQPEKHF